MVDRAELRVELWPLELRISARPARSPTRLRTIELAGDELLVPAQDGVGQRGVRDLRQGLATQPMTNFAQSCSLCVRQPQATLELGSENPVLSGQILRAYQKLLVDQAGNVSEHPSPLRIVGPRTHGSCPHSRWIVCPTATGSQNQPASQDLELIFRRLNFLTIREVHLHQKVERRVTKALERPWSALRHPTSHPPTELQSEPGSA